MFLGSPARVAFLWCVLAGWDKLPLRKLKPERRGPKRARVETCGLKSVGAEGGNGENGDAEGDQSHGCLLRMPLSLPGVLHIPPRILDIKSLYFSLFSEESHTEPNFYWKKGLIDSFQVLFLSSWTIPYKIRMCSNIERIEINIVRLMGLPPPLPNMLGKSFQWSPLDAIAFGTSSLFLQVSPLLLPPVLTCAYLLSHPPVKSLEWVQLDSILYL